MTETLGEVAESGLHQLQLESILLYDCSVNRGEQGVDPNPPGDVDGNVSLKSSQAEGLLTYEIAGRYSFYNASHQLVAVLEMTFLANYQKPVDIQYSESDLQEFAHSVVFQVTPFQREFLATMTNRMAVTPFYLPLLRAGDLNIVHDAK
jgi:hypothetical protein